MSVFSLFFFFLLLTLDVSLCHNNPLNVLNFEEAIVDIDNSITIQVSPNTLNQSGQWVTVEWSGVNNPSKHDWIGVYAPSITLTTTGEGRQPTVDPSRQAPVKYQNCSQSSSHMSSGEGSFKFRLVNLRAPYIFAFMTGGFDSPTLTAVSNTVDFTSYNEPLQGHLSLTHDPTIIRLTWSTKQARKPQVKWWQNLTSNTYIRIESALTDTYTVRDMCGPPATTVGYINPGLIHTVNMTGLTPGYEYSYQFGDNVIEDRYEWSPVYSFRVPPLPGPDVPTTIIAYGDMGQGQQDDTLQEHSPQPIAINSTKQIIDNELNKTDIVLHIGDISYARGYAGVWDEFFDLIQPIATRVPYMVSSGNHERDFPNSGSYYDGTDSGGECGVPYEKRFPMPRASTKEHWYGFSIGNVHIVLMSTELNHTIGSTQYNWLKDHLSTVNRTLTPWLIFSGHRPMYVNTKSDGDNKGAELLQENIEPLLMQYKVDLALWGHHHSFQRTCPVYKQKCTDGAPVHAIIGMAGHHLSTDIHHQKYIEWIKVVDIEHYGYSRISTTADTLTMEFITTDGFVQDTILLRHDESQSSSCDSCLFMSLFLLIFSLFTFYIF